ncbi:hypothetical protein [Acidianus ambivalens]|uniref:Uncharacterized protein n=1 Tax=Acidianus ambivalens TaxID=2283 RepID=A0A650CTA0_ACIAM|nr:hypothetical protein [Acidianus ambivalens]MQL55496.1 hypothetical protein [Acidianus ambivalens]QGR21028.1 hypothetical protein D1866_02545 [Acidianus ambivalens]
MIKKILSGFIGGLLEIIFFINNLSVFSTISYHILRTDSVVLGIVLHLIAAIIVALVGISIIEVAKIGYENKNFLSALIMGILFGSAVLSLFSLPVHLLVFPIKITLTYVLAHIFYGIITYLVYSFVK